MESVDAPKGIKITRIGQRGRPPKLSKVAWEDLTPNQRYQVKWREKTKERRLAWQRSYYQKQKARLKG